jgi:hypothetical protein
VNHSCRCGLERQQDLRLSHWVLAADLRVTQHQSTERVLRETLLYVGLRLLDFCLQFLLLVFAKEVPLSLLLTLLNFVSVVPRPILFECELADHVMVQ